MKTMYYIYLISAFVIGGLGFVIAMNGGPFLVWIICVVGAFVLLFRSVNFIPDPANDAQEISSALFARIKSRLNRK